MNDPKTIEAEVIPDKPAHAVVVRQSQEVAPSGLFGTQEPVAIIEKATAVATALKAVITKQGLVSRISGKEYPKCEAWTLLGTMLGVFPVLCWSRPVEGGWEARVEARTRDGATVGAAEAECLKSEKNWSNRDDFALRSMAQTRATAKCLRMPLGFVMTLAGYEATPAEEMVSDHPHKPDNAPGIVPASPPAAQTPAPVSQPPKTAPAPASAPQGPPRPIPLPTQESRTKMIATLKAGPGEANRDIVSEYFRKVPNAAGSDSPQLAPFEQLEDLNLRYVPSTTGQMNALAAKIAEFGNGLQVSMAFPPHAIPMAKDQAISTPATVLPKILKNAAHPQDAWRKFPMPFGKKAGVKLEDLEKNYLFGLWANYAVETEYKGRPKKPQTIAKDQEFRAMLDLAGKHYEFKKTD